MSEQIQPFDFEGNQVRVISDDGNPLFCGTDVARILGYANPAKAVADHCKGVTKWEPLQTTGGMQNVRFVSEGDLYRLLASSRLPVGERFESWVFDEVMPSIRKHGAYATPATIESIISDPSSGIKLLEALQAEREQKVRAQHDVARLAPKAQALDDFSDESGTYSVGGAAKLLANSGISIGENRLWDRLKLMGWVFRADGYWMAKQSRIDAGHLSMLQKPGSYQGRNGQSHSYHPQVRITRKGLVLLHRKITENQLVNQMGGDQ